MQLGARNQLRGTIKSMDLGAVIKATEVIIEKE